LKDTSINPKNGSMSRRWIGLKSRDGRKSRGSKGCPSVRGWQGELLLSQVLTARASSYRPTRKDLALIQKLGLDRFCVYTPKAGSQRPFVAPRGLKASMDRLAVSTAANEMIQGSLLPANSNGVEGALAKEFLSQAGQLPPGSGLPSGSPNVQVTVLDSQPEGSLPPPPPNSPQHGFAMAHLARELVCYGTPCAATVVSRRTLNYDDPNQTTVQLASDLPGSIGTISELALAITDAVLAGPQGKHLILNLSIGWDGEIDLGAQGLSEAAQAVRTALQLAAEKNVLVIAAAGNRRGGSLQDSNWPMLPAAWDRSPASHSLVYAVGGVDWQGLPLPNARTNGLPVRVAYGDHATALVDATLSSPYTRVYTGSSVSAAVVSATAAVIWHLRPDLTPALVMMHVDSSGEPQAALADFYSGHYDPSPPPPPQLRQISLCAAVQEACGPNGQSCAGASTAPQCPALQHRPPALSSLLARCAPPNLGTPFSLATSPPVAPPCHSGTLLLTTGGPVAPPICPTDQYSSISAQPWVLPQPGDDPCPNCALVPTGPPRLFLNAVRPSGSAVFASLSYEPPPPQYQLAIALNQSWITALKDADLHVTAMLDIDCFAPGEAMSRLTYPVQIDYQTDTAWTAFGFGEGKSLEGCRAQLNFVVQDSVGGTWSVQNPVVVDPEPSDITCDFPNSDGSTQGLGAISVNVVTMGKRERETATAPPL
jgi:hypothetical protein